MKMKLFAFAILFTVGISSVGAIPQCYVRSSCLLLQITEGLALVN